MKNKMKNVTCYVKVPFFHVFFVFGSLVWMWTVATWKSTTIAFKRLPVYIMDSFWIFKRDGERYFEFMFCRYCYSKDREKSHCLRVVMQSFRCLVTRMHSSSISKVYECFCIYFSIELRLFFNLTYELLVIVDFLYINSVINSRSF